MADLLEFSGLFVTVPIYEGGKLRIDWWPIEGLNIDRPTQISIHKSGAVNG